MFAIVGAVGSGCGETSEGPAVAAAVAPPEGAQVATPAAATSAAEVGADPQREAVIASSLRAAEAAFGRGELEGATAILTALGAVSPSSVHADAVLALEKKLLVERTMKAVRSAQAKQAEQERPEPPPVAPPASPVAMGSTEAQALYREARALHHSDPQRAITLYSEAAEAGDLRAYKQIGALESGRGNHALAIAAYERYLKEAPSAPEADMVRDIVDRLRAR